MQRTSSFIDSTTNCRILAISTYPLQQNKSITNISQYIQLPYNYTLSIMKNIQTYLCSSVKIIGIDFQDKPDPIPKLKNKLIYIKGIGEKGEKYNIKKYQDFQTLDWIVDIAIPLSGNPRQAYQQIKNNLQNNLILFKQSPIMEENLTIDILKNSKIYYLSNCNKKQLYTKIKPKIMTNRIPIGLLLPKLQIYKKSYILNMIIQDLTNAINIMASSQLLYRIVERHQGLLPIQNYLGKQNQRDQQFMKLVSKGKSTKKEGTLENKIKKQNQGKSMNQRPDVSIENSGGNKNVVQIVALISLLILLIGGYVAIKLL